MYNVYYMAILYHTTKFQSAKCHSGQIKIAKFSDRQYFWLYSIYFIPPFIIHHTKLYTVLALIILIIRTVYKVIYFSNSLNMLHLEILTRSIRPNDYTPVH